MKPACAKQKGRRLQAKLAADLRETLGLSVADVKPALMSENGMDLKLSEAARRAFPFAVEAKARESLSLWASIAQAEKNAESEGLRPLLAFKRNGSRVYVVLGWSDFLELAEKAKAANLAEVLA
jgi:hypothetical protein